MLEKILKDLISVPCEFRDDEFISPYITIWYLCHNGRPSALTSTYLEQERKNLGLELQQTFMPSAAEFKYLYANVGGPWMWWERLAMSDEKLEALYEANTRQLLTLRRKGQTVGFAEINRKDPEHSEIAYFGLFPETVGGGLGRCLMHAALDAAWHAQAKSVRLNTCSLDHPRALGFYQHMGFKIVEQKDGPVHIPKAYLDEGALQTRHKERP